MPTRAAPRAISTVSFLPQGLPNDLQRAFFTVSSQRLEFPALQLIVGNEKLLDALAQPGIEMNFRLNRLARLAFQRNRDPPVITVGFSVLGLLRFQHCDYFPKDQRAGGY